MKNTTWSTYQVNNGVRWEVRKTKDGWQQRGKNVYAGGILIPARKFSDDEGAAAFKTANGRTER